jgi:hypothetical protein
MKLRPALLPALFLALGAVGCGKIAPTDPAVRPDPGDTNPMIAFVIVHDGVPTSYGGSILQDAHVDHVGPGTYRVVLTGDFSRVKASDVTVNVNVANTQTHDLESASFTADKFAADHVTFKISTWKASTDPLVVVDHDFSVALIEQK